MPYDDEFRNKTPKMQEIFRGNPNSTNIKNMVGIFILFFSTLYLEFGYVPVNGVFHDITFQQTCTVQLWVNE